MKRWILLDSVDKVREFASYTQKLSYDVDMESSRRQYLDAKSILGIMSCDIRKPVKIEIHADEEECQEYLDYIDKFVVTQAV